MLRVSLIGHLGADPEVRSSQKGSSMVSFRVAVNLVRTTPDGGRQETTEWFSVRVMGGQAAFASRLGRGARVLVIGRLGISHYQSREGEARTGFDVWADEIQHLSPRAGGEYDRAEHQQSGAYRLWYSLRGGTGVDIEINARRAAD